MSEVDDAPADASTPRVDSDEEFGVADDMDVDPIPNNKQLLKSVARDADVVLAYLDIHTMVGANGIRTIAELGACNGAVNQLQ